MASDTSSSILQAAKHLFLTQGYTATAMHEIAAEAGIGKATIYHHFRSKEDILISLVTDITTQLSHAHEIISAVEEPRQRLRVAAEISIHFLYTSAELLHIARVEVPGLRTEMIGKFSGFFVVLMNLLEATIQSGIERGLFRPVDPRRTAEVFLTMIQGNFARYYLTGTRFATPEEGANELLKVFFNGINAVPEGQPADMK